MFKNLKLGYKFFISLMMISIIPLAILSFFEYYYTKAELKKSTIGNLRAINDSRADHINHLIQLRQEQAKELAGTFISRQLQAGGINQPDVIQVIQAQIDSIFHELKSTPSSNYRNTDKPSDIENVSIWDVHGNVIADTNSDMIGQKMPFEVLQILYERGGYFGGFQHDPFTGKNYISLLEEIHSLDSREYAGVLFIKTNAKILNNITTARGGLGKTAETYLINKDLQMITESRFVKDAILNVRVNTKGTNACFGNHESASIYKNYMGRMVLGVQKYLPDEDWCLLTEMDISEAFEPITVFRNQMFVMVGCLIVFIFVFVRLAGQTFIQPILALRDASKEVAQGNFSPVVKIQNKDEIGELSVAFNEMTRNLKQTTSELEEKNQELEKLDQMKSEFVSTVSHELRTPMTVIKESIAQVLAGLFGEVSDKQHKLLSMAQNNIDRLGRIINNLLDLSKLEDGKVVLHKEIVNITSLAQEVGSGFNAIAHKKGLEIKYDFSSEKIEALIDRDKIIQVFTNLIGNAMKFTSAGSITISIADKKDCVECAVIDTGKGIAQEDLHKVFNKFQQFGRQTGSGEKGTGLGLTISKGLVELHKGTIWVESKINEGTRFIFQFPKSA